VYTFSNAANGSYTLSFSGSGYTFNPSSVSVTVNGTNFTVATDIIATTGGSWVGTKQLGSTGNDEGRSVAVDASGNVYVIGFTNGGLDESINQGMFLVKYDASGTKQWIRQLSGASTNITAHGVAVDASGNVYVTDETDCDLDGNTITGSYGYDMFLVKYNSSGTKQWTRMLGSLPVNGGNGDNGSGVAVDVNGNIYVSGITQGNLDGNTNAGGDFDIFLVKYDASGTKQWTRQLGTSASDESAGVAVDTSGSAYVTGNTNGDLDGNSNAGGYDMFLVKYDASGSKQWTRQLGTSEADWAYDVSVDASGNVYVTGFTNGDFDGNTSEGNPDMFLVKYNSSGEKQWSRQLGTSLGPSYWTSSWGVDVDNSGNVYVTGTTGGNLDGNTSSGYGDIFLVKYNTIGTKQWTRQLGTSSGDYSFGVAADTSGNAFITSYTEGDLDGNTNAGGRDIFLVKYNTNGVKQ
jgi:hypothetical protein